MDDASVPSLSEGYPIVSEDEHTPQNGPPSTDSSAAVVASVGPQEPDLADSSQQLVELGGTIPDPSNIFDSPWKDSYSMDRSFPELNDHFPISSFQAPGGQRLLHPTFEDLLNPTTTYISPPSDFFSFHVPVPPSGQIEAGAATTTGLVDLDGELEDFGHVERLSDESYENLTLWVEMVGLTWVHGTSSLSVEPIKLPPLKELNSFTQLYFEYFHNKLPIIHRPTFDPRTSPALLVLAIASIGRRFSSLPVAGNASNELGLDRFIHQAALRHVRIFCPTPASTFEL